MTSSHYKQKYLAIKYDYDTQCSMDEPTLDQKISTLDDILRRYEQTLYSNAPMPYDNGKVYAVGNKVIFNGLTYTMVEGAGAPGYRPDRQGDRLWSLTAGASTSGGGSASLNDVSGAFLPIGQYYANLINIKDRLNKFLEKASDHVVESQDTLINKERYENRANPQDAVKPRELVFGLFSELRPSSVPILLAAGVFMACISLLMIFQMFGFTGQINVPPAISGIPGKLSAGAASSGPFYENPMILSGLVILLGAGVVSLGIMYYRAKAA